MAASMCISPPRRRLRPKSARAASPVRPLAGRGWRRKRTGRGARGDRGGLSQPAARVAEREAGCILPTLGADLGAPANGASRARGLDPRDGGDDRTMPSRRRTRARARGSVVHGRRGGAGASCRRYPRSPGRSWQPRGRGAGRPHPPRGLTAARRRPGFRRCGFCARPRRMRHFLDFEKQIAELEGKIEELRRMSEPEGSTSPTRWASSPKRPTGSSARPTPS